MLTDTLSAEVCQSFFRGNSKLPISEYDYCMSKLYQFFSAGAVVSSELTVYLRDVESKHASVRPLFGAVCFVFGKLGIWPRIGRSATGTTSSYSADRQNRQIRGRPQCGVPGLGRYIQSHYGPQLLPKLLSAHNWGCHRLGWRRAGRCLGNNVGSIQRGRVNTD